MVGPEHVHMVQAVAPHALATVSRLMAEAAQHQAESYEAGDTRAESMALVQVLLMLHTYIRAMVSPNKRSMPYDGDLIHGLLAKLPAEWAVRLHDAIHHDLRITREEALAWQATRPRVPSRPLTGGGTGPAH